jgi:hypothetical protein
MPTQVQFRRGTATQSNAFTGAAGEITIDTTAQSIRVHDGSTAGGSQLLSAGGTQTLTNKTIGAATISGNLTPSSNVAFNVGSVSSWFNNFYGSAVHALYADLAENYLADAYYPAGTVVKLGGSAEITQATNNSTAVLGVVSANPAYLMNGGLQGSYVTPVALVGRVMVNCRGPVSKGDIMVAGDGGYAIPNNSPANGAVIGKAVGSTSAPGFSEVEVVINNG